MDILAKQRSPFRRNETSCAKALTVWWGLVVQDVAKSKILCERLGIPWDKYEEVLDVFRELTTRANETHHKRQWSESAPWWNELTQLEERPQLSRRYTNIADFCRQSAMVAKPFIAHQ